VGSGTVGTIELFATVAFQSQISFRVKSWPMIGNLLQRLLARKVLSTVSNCPSLDLNAEMSEVGCGELENAMTSQTDMRRSVIPYASKVQYTSSEADQLDRVGSAILGLINQAADTTETDLQTAREAAEKLADRLRAAQNRINQLEANVRYYQDRTDRAEKWLHQISSEIEQRFFDADDSGSVRNSMR
jgi:DNA repair ATPase RecN